MTGTVPEELGNPVQENVFSGFMDMLGVLGDLFEAVAPGMAGMSTLDMVMLGNNSLSGEIPPTLCELGAYPQSYLCTGGLFFDCNDQLCGCEWCPCPGAENDTLDNDTIEGLAERDVVSEETKRCFPW